MAGPRGFVNILLLLLLTVQAFGQKQRVLPTDGTTDSLTVKMYMGGAGHLHYAVVRAKTSEPTAEQISAAVVGEKGFISKGTVTVDSPRLATATVIDLNPGTVYDVYYVTEALGSNGVYGAVSSSRGVATHALPPPLNSVALTSMDASTSDLALSANTNGAGDLHYIILPGVHTTFTDPWSLKTCPPTVGASASGTIVMEVAGRRDQKHTVEGLEPGKNYTVFTMTETTGSNGVFSKILSANATTHDRAPIVQSIKVEPTNGTAEAFTITFSADKLGDLHYIFMSHGTPLMEEKDTYASDAEAIKGKRPYGDVKSKAIAKYNGTANVDMIHLVTSLSPATTYDVYAVMETWDSKGVFSEVLTFPEVRTHSNPPVLSQYTAQPLSATTDTIEMEFRLVSPGLLHFLVLEAKASTEDPEAAQIAEAARLEGHYYQIESIVMAKTIEIQDGERLLAATTITELLPNATYDVHMVSETAGSFGLFGAAVSVRGVRTFAPAPMVTKAEVFATDALTDSLTLKFSLSESGDLHYLVLPQDSPKPTVLDFAREGDEAVKDKGTDGEGTDGEGGNVIVFDKSVGDTQDVQITGLDHASNYTVWILTETTGSKGVYGTIQAVHGNTHKEAPMPHSVEVAPVDASYQALQIIASVPKNASVLVHYVALTMDMKRRSCDPSSIYELALSGDVEEAGTTEKPPVKNDATANKCGAVAVGTASSKDALNECDLDDTDCAVDSLLVTSFVDGLQPDMTYEIFLIVETMNSNGVLSEVSDGIMQKTHAEAPALSNVKTPAVDGDPTAISLSFDLEKTALVHYSFTPVETGNAETIKDTAVSAIGGIVAGSVVVDEGVKNVSPISVVRIIGNFTPGTQYKLEIVTETLESNGVFGTVLNHENVETHALPPPVLSLQLQPIDADSNSLLLKYLVGQKPSSNFWWIIQEETDLFFKENGDVDLHSLAFNAGAEDFASIASNFSETAMGTLVEGKSFGFVPFEGKDASTSPENMLEVLTVSSLEPGVHYCAFVATETVGSYGVISEVSGPVCAMTHPSAPPVREEAATVVPAPGSTTSILLFYTLLPDIDEETVKTSKTNITTPEKEGGSSDDTKPAESDVAENITESTSSDIVSADMYTAKSCSHFIHFAVHVGKYSEKAPKAPKTPKEVGNNKAEDILSNFEYGNDIVAKGTLISIGGKSSATVTGLIPDSEYYVLFMAETAGSNGVYGPISQPVAVRTHAAAPMILERTALPMDASSSSALLSVSASMEGDVHFAVVPQGHLISGPSDILKVGNDAALTEGALNTHAHVDSTGAVVIASKSETETQSCPECSRGTIVIDTPGRDLLQEFTVENLQPGTPYDVYFVSETSDSRGVYGKVSAALPFTTHAVAPEIVSYSVSAEDAESDTLRLRFSLGTSGIVHYVVVPHSSIDVGEGESGNETAAGLTAQEMVSAVVNPPATPAANAKDKNAEKLKNAEESNEPVFLAVGQVACYSGLKAEHAISGLPAGMKFDVYLVAETIESGGVYGDVNKWESAYTHATAPDISGISVSAINGTAVGILMSFNLSRSGEVHYMVVPVTVEGGPAAAIKDGSSSLATAQGTLSVSHDVDISGEVTAIDDNSVALVYAQKEIHGLEPGIAYYVHVVPETSLSNGVFGEPLKAEVTTHREAAILNDVVVYPTDGTCSGLTIDFIMNEPGTLHYLVLPHVNMEATLSHDWGADLIAHPEAHMSDHGAAFNAAKGAHIATSGSEEFAIILQGKGHLAVGEWNPSNQLKVHDLQANRQYAVWLVTETSKSFGVFGKVTAAQVVKTHPEAPDTFEEPLNCQDAPDCDELQRVPCGLAPPAEDGDSNENTCGPCYPGFVADGIDGALPGNSSCVDCQSTPIEICSDKNRSPCGHIYDIGTPVQPNKCGPCLEGFALNSDPVIYGNSKCFDCRDASPEHCSSLQRSVCGSQHTEENSCGHCLDGFIASDPEDAASACFSCVQSPNCGALNRQPCGVSTGADTCGECLDDFFYNTEGEYDRNVITCLSCMGAPDCSSLNRGPCGSTGSSPNVCGLCLHGFIGIAGTGNTQCVADVHPPKKTDAEQKTGSGQEVKTEGTGELPVQEKILEAPVQGTPDTVNIAEDIGGEEVGGEEVGGGDVGEEDTGEEDAGEEDAGEENVGEEDTGEKDAGEEDAGEEECPTNAHMTEEGCSCDDGFTVNDEGTECVSVCPLHASPDANGDCECDDEFEPNDEGTHCVPAQ